MEEQKGIAIFDLDNTIIEGQSQQLLLNYLLGKRLITFPFYLRLMAWFSFYKVGLAKDPRRIIEYAYSPLRGVQVSEFEQIIDNFSTEKLQHYFIPNSVAFINQHRAEGKESILVSNAINFISGKVASILGINYLIATELETQESILTGKVMGDLVYGERKTELIMELVKKQNFSMKGSVAYADHISDLPILELVENPVVVNPDRLLRQEAHRRGWPTFFLKRTTLE